MNALGVMLLFLYATPLLIMGLDKSKLINRWRCDATRALEIVCLHCYALLEVIMTDLLNDYLKLYPLSNQFINHQIF